uniref:Uncharacterized protein n=2 Tax=Tetranychus urticae TaxID=32264 RepID=T1KKP2_TETUR
MMAIKQCNHSTFHVYCLIVTTCANTMINLNNKVALITGSSDGIGKTTAILFSSLGAKVAIVGRDQSKLDKVAAECEAKSPHGYRPVVIRADFLHDENIKRTFDETIAGYNWLDILVNDVGVVNLKSFDDCEAIADYDRVMQTNIRTAVILTHLAKPYLLESKGTIVNVSSVDSFKPNDREWSYCMSKAAVNAFTQSIAGLLAPHVRVNAIAPGPVKTGIFKATGDPEQQWEEKARLMPLGRIAEPIEIAQLIALLASDSSKNMTGSIVASDSGYLLTDPYSSGRVA